MATLLDRPKKYELCANRLLVENIFGHLQTIFEPSHEPWSSAEKFKNVVNCLKKRVSASLCVCRKFAPTEKNIFVFLLTFLSGSIQRVRVINKTSEHHQILIACRALCFTPSIERIHSANCQFDFDFPSSSEERRCFLWRIQTIPVHSSAAPILCGFLFPLHRNDHASFQVWHFILRTAAADYVENVFSSERLGNFWAQWPKVNFSSMRWSVCAPRGVGFIFSRQRSVNWRRRFRLRAVPRPREPESHLPANRSTAPRGTLLADSIPLSALPSRALRRRIPVNRKFEIHCSKQFQSDKD